MQFGKRSIGLLLFFSGLVSAHAQLLDGIYSVFHSHLGSITAEIHYAEAPLAAANFIGLAEGSRTWIEETTGLPRSSPYYDGQIVNRIADIPERIIQSGSQNGTNSGGGPGYTFPDELQTGFTHTTGTLSMANSGPHSNGSQFFFSLGNLSFLDDRHTIFGTVIDGLDILETIGSVPLTNSKPVTDVVWNQVEILRQGPAAQAFDVQAQKLPRVSALPMEISLISNEVFRLEYAQPSNAVYTASLAEGLQVWNPQSVLENPYDPFTNALTYTDSTPAGFVSLTVADYTPLFVPFGVGGAQFEDPDGSLAIDLDALTVETTNSLSAAVTGGGWSRAIHHGTLEVSTSASNPPDMDLYLHYTSPTGGLYRGLYFHPGGTENVHGSFTYTPP